MIPTIDGVPIGATTPSTGEFTNLTLGTETITNFSDIDDDKVKASSGDTAPGFLDSKIVAGTGITVTPGTNQVTISSTGGGGGSVEDSADGVEITFAEELEISPGVSGIFIRGTGLFADPATIISTVKAGKETYTIDAQAVLTGEQQVIVTPPTGIGRTAGHHRVKLVNAQGFSEGFISLSEIIAPPPAQGDAFTKLLLHGDGTGNSFLDPSPSSHYRWERDSKCSSEWRSRRISKWFKCFRHCVEYIRLEGHFLRRQGIFPPPLLHLLKWIRHLPLTKFQIHNSLDFANRLLL